MNIHRSFSFDFTYKNDEIKAGNTKVKTFNQKKRRKIEIFKEKFY